MYIQQGFEIGLLKDFAPKLMKKRHARVVARQKKL